MMNAQSEVEPNNLYGMASFRALHPTTDGQINCYGRPLELAVAHAVLFQAGFNIVPRVADEGALAEAKLYVLPVDEKQPEAMHLANEHLGPVFEDLQFALGIYMAQAQVLPAEASSNAPPAPRGLLQRFHAWAKG